MAASIIMIPVTYTHNVPPPVILCGTVADQAFPFFICNAPYAAKQSAKIISAIREEKKGFMITGLNTEPTIFCPSLVSCKVLGWKIHSIPFSGLIWGKNNTSCIEGWLVNSIHILSMPKPMPEVGGIPYSRARKKS